MSVTRFRILSILTLAFVFALSAQAALAQDNGTGTSQQSTDASSQTRTRTVSNGQKMKIVGTVQRRDADTFVVRDNNGMDTVVLLTDRTSVKTKGGFLRSGKNYGSTQILRGLNIEIEGRGDATGQLVADKIRFNESDMRVAQ